ncbi:MAG: hypothetical protein NTY32_05105 [Bacteroidia bacterium]|nr:hypothetical protein [Bacteroidia bacterium]
MKPGLILSILALALALSSHAQSSVGSGAVYNYYLNRTPARPLTVNPHKWVQQPQVNSWESMEQATNTAMLHLDGYGLYQLAYLEYVHHFTISKLNPKNMLYKAFEIGKANGDPYLMYWVTEFEGTAYFQYEYLQRQRNHAAWTDSVATEKKEFPVLQMLADLNDKCFMEMKELAKQYLQCAYLKDETYGLLNDDIRQKAQEIMKNASKK